MADVDEKKKKVEELQNQLREMLRSSSARATLARWINMVNPLGVHFTDDPRRDAFISGEKNFVAKILAEIKMVAPEYLPELLGIKE